MSANKITENQYIFIAISSMIGVGILSMASGLCKTAHQQGWISTFFGGLYPISIVVTAAIIDKKTNHADFWTITNNVYGKVLAHIFTITFSFILLTYVSAIISGYTNVLIGTISPYISPTYIIITIILVTTFIVIRGMTVIGRICELSFYLTIPLILFVTLFFIGKGSIINTKPFFSLSSELMKAMPSSFFAYTGVELCYIMSSWISNRKSTMKAGIIACAVTILLYTFVVYITIYYLGWEITSVLEFPLLYITETINIPIISNFRALFMFLWSAIILKTILCHSFGASYFLSQFSKLNHKKSSVITSFFALIYTFFMIPQHNRNNIVDTLTPYFVIYITLWGFITTILVSIKYRGGKR